MLVLVSDIQKNNNKTGLPAEGVVFHVIISLQLLISYTGSDSATAVYVIMW